jgi:exopolysaccharide production protein ExoZ
LRGLAACMVVLFHATQIWSIHVVNQQNSLAWIRGGAGVDIFFVISGFVMMVSSSGMQGAHPGRDFLERRWIRIAPLYWIITSVVLMQLLLQSHPEPQSGSKQLVVSLPYVVSSYLFIPYRNSLGSTEPLLSVGWTLSFEMFFYFLFAAGLALRISVVRFLAPIMVTLVIVGNFRQHTWPALTVLANPLLLEFLAGVLLGYAVLQGVRLQWQVAMLLGVLGLVAIPILPAVGGLLIRILIWGVPALLIVMSGVMLEDRFGKSVPRWALLLGDASYSLYLSHLLVMSMAGALLVRLHVLAFGVTGRPYKAITILVCVSLSIFGSLLLYWWVENPLNKTLRRRLRLRQQIRAVSRVNLQAS